MEPTQRFLPAGEGFNMITFGKETSCPASLLQLAEAGRGWGPGPRGSLFL